MTEFEQAIADIEKLSRTNNRTVELLFSTSLTASQFEVEFTKLATDAEAKAEQKLEVKPALNLATTERQYLDRKAAQQVVIAFLLGEATLNGLNFSDPHPEKGRGLYWWRDAVREAFRG